MTPASWLWSQCSYPILMNPQTFKVDSDPIHIVVLIQIGPDPGPNEPHPEHLQVTTVQLSTHHCSIRHIPENHHTLFPTDSMKNLHSTSKALLTTNTTSHSHVEVCTGSKLKPNPARTRDCLTQPDPTRAARLNLEPEPDPRSPPPQRIAQQKKKGKRLHFTIACKK